MITLTAAVPVGTTLFILAGQNFNSGTGITVTDNLATHNTYTQDVSLNNSNMHTTLFHATVTQALAVGNTVTFTFPGGTGVTKAATLFSYRGVLTAANPKDVSVTASGTSTSASATTAATSQANELVIGGVTNATTGVGNNNCAALAAAAGTAGTFQVVPVAKMVTAIGAQTCGAATANSAWTAIVATYKVDQTNPTQSVSVVPATGTNVQYWNSGSSTLFYNPSWLGGTFNITDSPADSESGIAGDTFPGLNGYNSEVLADTPLAYWRLGETSGTTATDSMGTPANGTYTGGYTQGATGALTGDSNKAVTLNGTTGYVAVGNPAKLQITTGTAEAWFKTSDASAGYHNILQKQNAYSIVVNGGMLGEYDPGSNSLLNTGVNVADGQWHLVDVTFTSGTANGTKFYLDGNLVLTTTYTQTGQTLNLQLGANGAGVEWFNGSLDEVAIYGTQLTQARIMTHYRTGATVVPAQTGFTAAGTTLTAAAWQSLTHTFTTANTTAPSAETIAAVDVAGNAATSIVNFVRDVAAPSGGLSVTLGTNPSVQFYNSGTSTYYYNPSTLGGDFTVTGPSADASGIAQDVFPGINGTSSQILAQSPVLYWRFTETSGTAVADSAAGGLNGGTVTTVAPGTATRNVASALPGDPNPAITFTRAPDRATS